MDWRINGIQFRFRNKTLWYLSFISSLPKDFSTVAPNLIAIIIDIKKYEFYVFDGCEDLFEMIIMV